MTDEPRPPFPPFDTEGAIAKVQAAEDAWNTRDPHRVSLAYTPDSVWRNRDQFVTGRAEIVEFLTAKWERELDYVLRNLSFPYTPSSRPIIGRGRQALVRAMQAAAGRAPHGLRVAGAPGHGVLAVRPAS